MESEKFKSEFICAYLSQESTTFEEVDCPRGASPELNFLIRSWLAWGPISLLKIATSSAFVCCDGYATPCSTNIVRSWVTLRVPASKPGKR